jgi:hypothetical protein
LPADRLPAIDRQDPRAEVTAVAVQRLRNLDSQFACRYQYQRDRLRLGALLQQALQYRKGERGRLPGTGRGLPEQIAATTRRSQGGGSGGEDALGRSLHPSG